MNCPNCGIELQDPNERMAATLGAWVMFSLVITIILLASIRFVILPLAEGIAS